MMKGAMVVAALAAAMAAPLWGQRRPYREPIAVPPSAYLGVDLQLGQATGEFSNYVEISGGIAGSFLYTPIPDGAFGLRVGAMYLIYGSTTNRYPLVPGITVDVTTNNQIAGLTVGPQLTFGRGALRWYARGGIGFSYFSTTSSVRGSGGTEPFASSTNYDDFTFASEGGSGLLVALGRGRKVALDVGARFLNNGRVTYVTKNGVSVSGNTLVVDPIDSEANLIVYHLGVLIGLRRKPPEPPR